MKAIDLFAGAGGFTEGAEQAGVQVIWCANHWAKAVEIHKLNHPKCAHSCQDLRQADFTEVPDFDLLLASPACQGHSRARGKDRPHHDSSRASAYAVFECAVAKMPKYIVVENVRDFTTWGTKAKPGVFYGRWRDNFEDLGYQIQENYINASTLGVAQERTRLFITMTLGKKPIVVKEGNYQPVPAWQIIDWFGKHQWSPVRKEGRSPKTLRQVDAGRLIHGDLFLVEYYGTATNGRSLNRPLGTITTKDRYALVDGSFMRMLTADEYRRAQDFRRDYILPEDHKTSLHMIGNSVVPTVARHVIETVLAA